MAGLAQRSRFWGPHFPDVWDYDVRHWGPHFPDPGPLATDVQPTEPLGVATLVLLEDGLTVTYEWQTDIFKAHDGTEQRRAILDNPRRRFAGSALMIGSQDLLTQRAQLQRYAASGAAFSLGLAFESMLLVADADGADLAVTASALSNCDWANPGQRVVIIGRDLSSKTAVLQSAGGTTISLDVAPGATGLAGGYIAPLVSVYLDPQQSFDRWRTPDGFERWNIKATAAGFGFLTSAVAASLNLNEEFSLTNLAGVVLQARSPGASGNAIRVEFLDDSLSGVDVQEAGTDVSVHFEPGDTTVGELAAAINASSTLVKMVGAWTPTTVLGVGDSDTFGLSNLTGGADGDTAEDGVGATVATLSSQPIFDRPIVNTDTNQDALLALTEMVELGATPTVLGPAQVPDWARAIVMESPLDGEWQWFKRFTSAVYGACVEFWLPTWRADLPTVSHASNVLTVTDLDFFAWYPRRRNVMVLQADGTQTFATIFDVTDNGNGTLDVELTEVLSGATVDMVSWLELARFEQDAITVSFKAANFALSTAARVVTR